MVVDGGAVSDTTAPTLDSVLEQHSRMLSNGGLSNGGPTKPRIGSNGDSSKYDRKDSNRQAPPKLSSDILEPTNIGPPPVSPSVDDAVEEAVFTFDHLVAQPESPDRTIDTNHHTIPNGHVHHHHSHHQTHNSISTLPPRSHSPLLNDLARKRDKVHSFIDFSDEHDLRSNLNDPNNSNRDSRSSSRCSNRPRSRLRRFQTTGGSFDHAYYRNDEELKNVFSNGNSNSSSRNAINNEVNGNYASKQNLSSKLSRTSSVRTNDDDEEIDWNDFQGHLEDDVIEPNGNDDQTEFSYSKQNGNTDEVVSDEQEKAKEDISIDKEVEQIVANHQQDDDDDSSEFETEDEDDQIVTMNEDEDELQSSMLYGKLQKMEAEQDILNNSLLALSSHFAQVQFRLAQIVDAKEVPLERRDALLKELETFANRGIPELMLTMTPSSRLAGGGHGNLERSVSMATSLMADDVFEDDEDELDQQSMTNQTNDIDCDSIPESRVSRHPPRQWRNSQSSCGDETMASRSRHGSCSTNTIMITEEKLERQRSRQKELIVQLKDQLEDLERYAYETGDLNALPSSMLLERQNAIIEQLKSKLPVLSIDEIDKLSPEELRRKVDSAVRELVNPVIMKEQLVCQLKTQVSDLERFIEFLQQGGKAKHKLKLSKSTSTFAQMSKFLKLTKRNNNKSNRKVSKSDSTENEDIKATEESNSKINDKTDEPKCDKTPSTKLKPKITNNEDKSASGKNAKNSSPKDQDEEETRKEAANIMHRIQSLLHVFAWTQLGGCASFAAQPENQKPTQVHPRKHSSSTFEQNSLKKVTRHWGDLRAHLELAITNILELYREKNMNDNTSDYTSESESDFITLGTTSLVINNYFAYEQMTVLVRKEFASSLRNLIQHGLIGAEEYGLVSSKHTNGQIPDRRIRTTNRLVLNKPRPIGHYKHSNGNIGANTRSIISFGLGCFGVSSGVGLPSIASHTPVARPMHAWELVLYYYDLKHGSKFRCTPTRRLSQSFGLQVVTGASINPKHSLLAAIDDIIDSHTRLKRSLDSHWKAFVCMGLNQQMLAQWLRLIVRNTSIVSDCYEKWSYTASTGFEDTLRQLDKLCTLRYCLPTDIAVRQLQSIHDAF